MDIGTALVVIAGIGAFYSLRSQRIRHGGSGFRGAHHGAVASGEANLPSPRESELLKEVQALRERIHVLERIATDANTTRGRDTRALAEEIESLREA